jgi:hypothetical protein
MNSILLEKIRPARKAVAKIFATFGPNYRRAAILDRIADLELSLGHHDAAERLSSAAAAMREGRPQ